MGNNKEGLVMDNRRLICPMEYNDKAVQNECRGSSCAWWCHRNRCCAVMNVSHYMFNITDLLYKQHQAGAVIDGDRVVTDRSDTPPPADFGVKVVRTEENIKRLNKIKKGLIEVIDHVFQ